MSGSASERPGATHQRPHLGGGEGAVAVGVLHLGGQFGHGLAKGGDERQRVVAETALALAPGQDLATPAAEGDQGLGVVGGTQGHQGADEAGAALGLALQPVQQQRVVGLVLPGAQRLALQALGGAQRRVHGALHAGVPAQRVHAQAGVVGDRGQAGAVRGVAGLGQRVLDEGDVGLLGLDHAQAALRHQLQRQLTEERRQLLELLRVVGGQHQAHRAHSCTGGWASASFWACTRSAMPWVARASIASISARLKGTPSAVPWTSTKPPAPVITTFMSVSQAESSTYSRSSSGVPWTMPTEMAATWSRMGSRDSALRASRPLTASRAAMKAPVMAAVRVPPSACSTSQSRVMVRSPRADRSNTARSERPIRRWISCVRPVCLPLAASRALRVWVARGSMPYSAVTQPSPEPFLCGGTRSSTEAVHSTRVWPNSISTEPSAWRVKPRVMRTGRSWSGGRPLGRAKAVVGWVI